MHHLCYHRGLAELANAAAADGVAGISYGDLTLVLWIPSLQRTRSLARQSDNTQAFFAGLVARCACVLHRSGRGEKRLATAFAAEVSDNVAAHLEATLSAALIEWRSEPPVGIAYRMASPKPLSKETP